MACHWIRGHNHSELMWIVGDRSRFNDQGAVPTASTAADILRKNLENTWPSLRLIRLLTGLAALWHDLGKAGRSFQKLLCPAHIKQKNIYRHEWISLRLFQAFVGSGQDDAAWLRRLAAPPEIDDQSWLAGLQKDGLNAEDKIQPPFTELPPLAAAVAWLFLSHHRLPCPPDKDYLRQEFQLERQLEDLRADWNQPGAGDIQAGAHDYWQFPQGLPVRRVGWQKRAAALARELLGLLEKESDLQPLKDPFIMHLSRLALMLGDHRYSSFSDPRQRLAADQDYALWANTFGGQPNQKLDEHLLGVEKYSGVAARSLPHLSVALPHLGRNKKLRARSGERFQWQNRAVELAEKMRRPGSERGLFIVNMASTGCGKTLANLKIINALAEPNQGPRCAFALGLRVLTRQTGNEYRNRLGLGEESVAILAGGAATRRLYEQNQDEDQGAASAAEHTLLDEDAEVLYEGETEDSWILEKLLPADSQAKAWRLLAAPLLCCTIDHLMPATESLRGGRQIAPMLRLLSGDLVLDELDDYDLGDLPALTRLVFWAGLLGSRVLISSATIPPALAQGMFSAYLAGRRHFQRNRGERPLEPPSIGCAWLDEFQAETLDCTAEEAFAVGHRNFADRRLARLEAAPARRRAEILTLPNQKTEPNLPKIFAEQILQAAITLHKRHHIQEPHSGRRVSFGLARLANIEPLFETARVMFGQAVPQGFHIHLCVYHSQFPLLLRSGIEQRLDQTLKRQDGHDPCSRPEIRRLLEIPAASGVTDHLFLVLASPIAEVGRDHDYDWAVIEPSSLRSLIQLAGRIRRHRPPLEVEEPNLIIFDHNYKSLAGQAPAYWRPGFENDGEFRLREHSLKKLLREKEYRILTSMTRLRPHPDGFDPQTRLADLEHARLKKALIPPPAAPAPGRRGGGGSTCLGAYSCWRQPQAMLSGLLQKKQPFRQSDGRPKVDLYLAPDETGDNLTLIQLFKSSNGRLQLDVDVSNLLTLIELESGLGVSAWGETDYRQCLREWSEKIGLEERLCARRFGTVTLPESPLRGWNFHPALGFAPRK
ncbi:type I-F CRISPR-associated helicase Cas3 [Deltaproteobacteria bacterium]|nr:type I-F CRISPR-associated helicase Cas3 [Deltaproteobacteria bacterium]